jgi:CubicO group peptidase (beta-lactamase class C family)
MSCTGENADTPVFTRADGVALSAAQIDTRVEQLMTAAQVVGLGLALIHDGEIAYLQAYGLAKIEDRTPLRTDTVMYGASLTKPAFTWMVMTLVDEGIVDLDRPIAS